LKKREANAIGEKEVAKANQNGDKVIQNVGSNATTMMEVKAREK